MSLASLALRFLPHGFRQPQWESWFPGRGYSWQFGIRLWPRDKTATDVARCIQCDCVDRQSLFLYLFAGYFNSRTHLFNFRPSSFYLLDLQTWWGMQLGFPLGPRDTTRNRLQCTYHYFKQFIRRNDSRYEICPVIVPIIVEFVCIWHLKDILQNWISTVPLLLQLFIVHIFAPSFAGHFFSFVHYIVHRELLASCYFRLFASFFRHMRFHHLCTSVFFLHCRSQDFRMSALTLNFCFYLFGYANSSSTSVHYPTSVIFDSPCGIYCSWSWSPKITADDKISLFAHYIFLLFKFCSTNYLRVNAALVSLVSYGLRTLTRER